MWTLPLVFYAGLQRSSGEAITPLKAAGVRVSAMKPACEGPVEHSEARMLT